MSQNKDAKLPEWISDLAHNPSALPGIAADEKELSIIETHISIVLIGKSRVFKFKKPVELPFLDQRSLAQRSKLIDAEIRLNSRLSPDVYLDKIEINDRKGKVVDYALVMRHLDDNARLEARLGNLECRDEILELARRIFHFHRDEAPTAEPLSHFGKRFADVLDQLESLGEGELVNRLRRLGCDKRSERWLRQRRHCQVNGHGDLRLDHIYLLPQSIEIIDCVEFSAALREVDPWEDLAFTIMGLELEGRADLATALARLYLALSGDLRGYQLIDLYVVYRAAVRLMVDHLQGEAKIERVVQYRQFLEDYANGQRSIVNSLSTAPAAAAAAKEATSEAQGATGHGDEELVVILLGLPVSGKSRLAKLLACEGMPVVATDAIRKHNQQLRRNDTPDYSKRNKRRVYQQMIAAANLLRRMERGDGVVLDGNFSKRDYRRMLCQRLARATPESSRRLRLLLVEARCSDDSARERLAARSQRKGLSDVRDYQLYRQLADAFEPLDQAELTRLNEFFAAKGVAARLSHVVLSTDGAPRQSKVLDEIMRRAEAADERA